MYLSRKNKVYLIIVLIMSCCSVAANAEDNTAATSVPAAITPAKEPASEETHPAVPAAGNAAAATPVQAATPAALPHDKPEETAVEKAEAAPETPVNTAAEAPVKGDDTAEGTDVVDVAPAPANMLESEEQKRAYASGVTLAHVIEEQLSMQKDLHITLNKNILLAGIADAFRHQIKMSDEDIRLTMSAFDEQVRVLTRAKNEKQQAEDKAYVESFAKQDGVKKTKQGFLYLIDKKGTGPLLKDADTVKIDYKGSLVDGTIIDGPQVENAYQIFKVADMPPVLRDSVKLIGKGGRITVVVPPSTLEKPTSDNDKDAPLLNTVLIYTIVVADDE